jgi:hypothetical protein
MLRIRALIAVLCTFTWCSAILHANLEAVGWMVEHAHWHGHSHHPAEPTESSSPTGGGEEHETLVARGPNDHQTIHVPATGYGPGPEPVEGFAPTRWRHPAPATEPPLGRPPDPGLRTEWCFLWRCAPDAVAPPVVG